MPDTPAHALPPPARAPRDRAPRHRGHAPAAQRGLPLADDRLPQLARLRLPPDHRRRARPRATSDRPAEHHEYLAVSVRHIVLGVELESLGTFDETGEPPSAEPSLSRAPLDAAARVESRAWDPAQPVPRRRHPQASLTEYVLGGAAARGDKPALIDGASGAVTTYAEFADQVARAAAGLAAEGIGPGDAVGLLGPNSPTGRSRSTRSSRSARSSRRSTRCSTPARSPSSSRAQARGAVIVGRAAARLASPRPGSSASFTLEALPDGRRRRGHAGGRPGRRPRGAAVLQRHHRRVEGRDAHAPQPRREHGADPLHAPDRRRRRAGRRCCRSSTSTARPSSSTSGSRRARRS